MKATPAKTVLWAARPARGEWGLLVGCGCIGEFIGQLTRSIPGIAPCEQ